MICIISSAKTLRSPGHQLVVPHGAVRARFGLHEGRISGDAREEILPGAKLRGKITLDDTNRLYGPLVRCEGSGLGPGQVRVIVVPFEGPDSTALQRHHHLIIPHGAVGPRDGLQKAEVVENTVGDFSPVPDKAKYMRHRPSPLSFEDDIGNLHDVILHVGGGWLQIYSFHHKDEGKGSPQGSPISPLLSNIYMRRFVKGWKTGGYEQRLKARIVNYADDIVICCRGTAQEALAGMRGMMSKLKLTVNEAKTRLCRLPEESFDFLGYTIGRCYSPRTGEAYLGPRPSRKVIARPSASRPGTPPPRPHGAGDRHGAGRQSANGLAVSGHDNSTMGTSWPLFQAMLVLTSVRIVR